MSPSRQKRCSCKRLRSSSQWIVSGRPPTRTRWRAVPQTSRWWRSKPALTPKSRPNTAGRSHSSSIPKRLSRRLICSEKFERRAIASTFIFTPSGSTCVSNASSAAYPKRRRGRCFHARSRCGLKCLMCHRDISAKGRYRRTIPYSGCSPISVSGAAPCHCQGASFRTNTPSGPVRRSTRIRATPTSDLLEGPLEFANMPISVDTSQLNERDGRQFYWDLRPISTASIICEWPGTCDAQLCERDPAIRCINMLTHNDYDFADPESRVGCNYRKAACDETNIKAVGATLGEIVDDVLNEPYVAPKFDKSGGRIFLNVYDRPR